MYVIFKILKILTTFLSVNDLSVEEAFIIKIIRDTFLEYMYYCRKIDTTANFDQKKHLVRCINSKRY